MEEMDTTLPMETKATTIVPARSVIGRNGEIAS